MNKVIPTSEHQALVDIYRERQIRRDQLRDELHDAEVLLGRASDELAVALCPYSLGQLFANSVGEKAVMQKVVLSQDEDQSFFIAKVGRVLKRDGTLGTREVSLHSGWRPIAREEAVPVLPSVTTIRKLLLNRGVESNGLRLSCYEDGSAVVVQGRLSWRLLDADERESFVQGAAAILDKAGIVYEIDRQTWELRIKPQQLKTQREAIAG